MLYIDVMDMTALAGSKRCRSTLYILTPPLPLDTMNVDSSYIQSMIDQPRPKRPLSAFNLF